MLRHSSDEAEQSHKHTSIVLFHFLLQSVLNYNEKLPFPIPPPAYPQPCFLRQLHLIFSVPHSLPPTLYTLATVAFSSLFAPLRSPPLQLFSMGACALTCDMWR